MNETVIATTRVEQVLEQLTAAHAADPQTWLSLRELTGGSDEWIPPHARSSPARRDYEAVRQAVAALAKRGKIDTRYEWRTLPAHRAHQSVWVTVARLAQQ